MAFESPKGWISGTRLRAGLVLVVAAGLPLLAVAPAGATTLTAKKPCGTTASGAAWKYKGQHGTQYTIIAVNGSPSLCTTGAKWMNRLSRDKATFQLKIAPPGWRCSAIGDYSGLAKMGQCLDKGAIIEWLPKLKK